VPGGALGGVGTAAVTAATRAPRPHRWPTGLAWALWALAMLGVATIPWFDHLLRQAHRPELTQLDATAVPMVLAALVAATVGAVLASRRPHHPVGWLLLALGLAVTASGVADGYARYGLLGRPSALPAARWVAVYSPATLYLAFVCIGFVLLLTPSGSLPSPRWRWWARLAAAAPVGFLLALAVGPGLVIPPYDEVIDPVSVPPLASVVAAVIAVSFTVAIGGLTVGAWSLVVRFRRARGSERQQLRWVAFAAALTVPPAAVVLYSVVVDTTATVAVLVALGICMALLPLAIGAAILRYRLYDLDRIISRTLAYGLLTLLLGGGYALVVLGLGQLLGRDSSLVVAAATLAVAAVFQPARGRIQRVVDRRFNRRRHDAGRIIEAFGTRLRDQVDLDTLTAEVLAVVDQTMQPTQASLWLRPPGPSNAIATVVDAPTRP
jgi:hypothetical protein